MMLMTALGNPRLYGYKPRTDNIVQRAAYDNRESGTYTNLDYGLNFSNKALEHMGESGHQVPVQTLQDAIRYGQAMLDPRGTSA